jgi:hypothetical protein
VRLRQHRATGLQRGEHMEPKTSDRVMLAAMGMLCLTVVAVVYIIFG